MSEQKERPLVSVVMITYRHEEFIREAVEGVLMQNADFPVELIVADDHSPNDTSRVVKDIKNTHPRGNIIKYTRHEQNKGMMPNFTWALKKAKGKYIALCEGDDFWTSPDKLQKQVDFLEINKEYSSCAHDVRILYEDPYDRKIYFTEKKLETIEEVTGLFYPTCSVVFRAKALGNLEIELLSSAITGGDKILQYICFKHGKSHFINEKMGCYRKNKGGVSYNSILSKKGLEVEKEIYSSLNRYFSFNHNEHFSRLMLINQVRINQILKQEKKLILFTFGIIKGLQYIRSVDNLKLLLKDSFTKL